MESPNEEKFIPKGAMAFFILLVILALLGVGWWLLHRQGQERSTINVQRPVIQLGDETR